jgi:Tfp pilus assembly protein PilX
VSRLRNLFRAERGNTLAELTVVCALLGLIGAVIFQSMISTTRASNSGQDRAFAVAETRTTIERFERDIRAANPIEAAASIADYDDAVSFYVFCSSAGVGSCQSNNQRKITWQYDDVTKTLTRLEGGSTALVLGPSGPAGIPVDQQHLAVVNPSTEPIFRYHDRTGALMPTDATFGGSVNDFRHCAKEVVVTLVVRAEDRTNSVIDLQTSATLRNHNEVFGC